MINAEHESKFRAALLHSDFSHCSIRQWCGMQCYVYHHNPKSPSGVFLAEGMPLEDAEPILEELRKTAHLGPQRGDMAGVL